MSRALEFLAYRKRAFQLELGRGMKAMSGWRAKLLRLIPAVRRAAYRIVFNAAHSIVLRDMAVFCRAFETCVVPGDRDRSLILEGRREYWLRVMDHLNLSVDQQYRIYGGVLPPEQTDSETEGRPSTRTFSYT